MKFKIPLVPLVKFGIPCPRPEVLLEVRTRDGDFLALRFVVDTGTDITTIPLPRAETYALAFERSEQTRVAFQGSGGAGVGHLGMMVVRLGGREYTWPCCFTVLPQAVASRAPSPGTRTRLPPSLLGRAGFLADCAVRIDEPYLVISMHGPFGRWWRSLGRRVRSLW